MSFLSTWVYKSDEDYRNNLKKGLLWVKITIEENLVIGARKFSKVFKPIDASYDVQGNTRINRGGAISIEYRIIYGKSSKQKINVKSST